MNALSELNFTVKKIKREERFLVTQLTLIFAAEGEMIVESGEGTFRMGVHDILIPESGYPCVIRGGADTICALVTYAPDVIRRMASGDDVFFLCNSTMDNTHSYSDLRDIFFELLRGYVQPLGRPESRTEGLMLKLLDTLFAHYCLEKNGGTKGGAERDERTQRVIQYVLANYREELNLTALAESMYVSTSTLSRAFHKSTGVYFADFVSRVRASHAAQAIVLTDAGMTKIAYDAGFSSSSAFNKTFRKIYGMAPGAYREMKKAEAERLSQEMRKEEDDIRDTLHHREEYIRKIPAGGKETSTATRIDFSLKDEGTKYHKPWLEFINLGPLSEAAGANVQDHILYLRDNIHIKGVRVWSVFAKRFNITDRSHKGSYNFDTMDRALDFLVNHGLRVYLDLSPRIDTIYRGGRDVVRWNLDYDTPDSKADYADLMAKFLRHVIHRYGRDIVSEWIFEISYDPFHPDDTMYYRDDNYNFYDVYTVTYDLIKKALPEAKVGGPSGIISYEWDIMTEFLPWAKDNDCVPDFLSFMLYPYGVDTNAEGQEDKSLMARKDGEISQLNMIQKLKDSLGLKDIPVYISEFNNTISGRNTLNDSCFRSAYYAEKLIQIWTRADMIVPMMVSDWIDADVDFHGIAGGGLGILTKDTITKPVFDVLRFFDRMGHHVIGRGSNWVITQRNSHDFYILAVNFKWFSKKYFLETEDIPITIQQTDYFESGQPERFVVKIRDALGEEYHIKTRSIRPSSGNLISEWAELGYEKNLTRNDISYLQRACFPRLRMQSVKPTGNHEISFEIEPRLHEVLLVHVYDF